MLTPTLVDSSASGRATGRSTRRAHADPFESRPRGRRLSQRAGDWLDYGFGEVAAYVNLHLLMRAAAGRRGLDRMVTISTVSEFLQSITRPGGALGTAFLHRGPANSQWRVDCSAARWLALDPAVDATRIWACTCSRTWPTCCAGPHATSATCPELPGGCSELKVLAQLQHQGAATGLIDFSTKPLVALWFACSGHPKFQKVDNSLNCGLAIS